MIYCCHTLVTAQVLSAIFLSMNSAPQLAFAQLAKPVFLKQRGEWPRAEGSRLQAQDAAASYGRDGQREPGLEGCALPRQRVRRCPWHLAQQFPLPWCCRRQPAVPGVGLCSGTGPRLACLAAIAVHVSHLPLCRVAALAAVQCGKAGGTCKLLPWIWRTATRCQ